MPTGSRSTGPSRRLSATSSVASNSARHPGFRTDDRDRPALRMGFMHAIQAGHTSLENALLRILDLMDETRPRGDAWHADLIGRAGQELCPSSRHIAARAGCLGRRNAPVPQPCNTSLRQLRSRPDRADDRGGGDLARHLAAAIADVPPGDRPLDHAAFASIRCAISVSAICTAFSAAPLRRLSETHQNDSPCATVGSLRMRLTNTASSPAHSSGVT